MPRRRKAAVAGVRAFMQMREQLAANAAILKRLAEIDKTLLELNFQLIAGAKSSSQLDLTGGSFTSGFVLNVGMLYVV